METEKLETLAELLQKYPNGFMMPDHLRPKEMLPKPPSCRYCECGYIIPEPTEEELKIKAQQAKIEEQSQAINTLTESMKFLTEHLAKLTTAFNEIVKEK